MESDRRGSARVETPGAPAPRWPPWQRLCERVRATGVLWSRKGGTFMAASQAFHIALAFFPLLLLGIAVCGVMLRSESTERVRERVMMFIAGEASPVLADQIDLLLGQVKAGATLGGQVGLAALVASLLSIFYHMQKAFDLIWDVPALAAGRFLRTEVQRFLSWMGIGLLVMLVFAASLVTSVLQVVPSALTLHLGALAIGPSLAATTLVFGLVYKIQPRAAGPWRDVWPGAALAAVAWEIGRQLLAVSVGSSRYSAYGVVGSFLIVMVWLYFANSILYLGAMFVRARTLEDAQDG